MFLNSTLFPFTDTSKLLNTIGYKYIFTEYKVYDTSVSMILYAVLDMMNVQSMMTVFTSHYVKSHTWF